MGQKLQTPIRVKCKNGRGAADANSIVQALTENWEEVKSYLAAMNDDTRLEIKNHLNNLIEDQDALGDALFDSKQEFESVITLLNSDELEQFTNELIQKGGIDEAFLTSEE